MTSPPAPDKRMLVGVPVGGGGHHFLPGFKTASFQGERTQRLPPGVHEIEIGGIGGLIDEFPTGMMDHEEQEIVAMMHVQIIQDGIDAHFVESDLLVDEAEKVDEVLDASSGIALRPRLSCRLPQRPKDIAAFPGVHNRSLAWRALLGERSHRWPLAQDSSWLRPVPSHRCSG